MIDVLKADVTQEINGDYRITLVVSKRHKQAVEDIYNLSQGDKPIIAEIKRKTNKRSLDANAYCWVLSDKIAEKVNTTKETVYKNAIKSVGVFKTLLKQNEAIEDFIRLWNKTVLGSFAEVMHESKKNKDCSVVITYFGSSTYNTAEMARLIDYLVTEAKELEIPTDTPEEIERIKNLWS